MSSLFPPFLRWGHYTSKDGNAPDILEIEPVELDTFETEYSINVLVKVDGKERILPIHNFESRNRQLYKIWLDGVKKNKIKVGRKFKLKTWLGMSKNKFQIRRFDPIF